MAVPPVEAVAAQRGALPLSEELSGIVRARNQVAIRPEISGTVVEVLARDGDPITAGQPLVRLDPETLTEQLRRAEAELRVAEASAIEARARVDEIRARAVRTRALTREGLSSELELETLEGTRSAVRLMNRLGATPVVSPEERCCGHDLLWNGDRKSFESLARFNTQVGTVNVIALDIFTCLLERYGEIQQGADEIAGSLVDWIDDDQRVYNNSGSEDLDYLSRDPPYRTASRMLTSPSELLLLDGMNIDTYEALQPYITALPVAEHAQHRAGHVPGQCHPRGLYR